jgi:signal transduction histidine kinase
MENSEDSPLVNALERERRFLAEELHEGLCQTLCGISIHLKVLQRRLESSSPELAKDYRDLQHTLEEGIDQSRQLYRTLKPTLFGGDSLMEAMAELVKAKQANLDLGESFCEEADRITPKQANALLRIAQEALRDSALNPTVKNTSVNLQIENSSVRMRLADDREDSSQKRDEVSLEVMAAHANTVHGSATVEERSNGTIDCRIPLTPK